MTGVRFYIIENGKETKNGLPGGGVIEIPFPNGKPNPFRPFGEQFILDHYNKLKEENPNAQIPVVVENIISESYMPMTRLINGDILGLLKKVDAEMRKGIL
jgi:hypothetical protein